MVGGGILWTDGGWNGAMTMGRHQAQWADTVGHRQMAGARRALERAVLHKRDEPPAIRLGW